jgi:hypothetical protein
MRLALLVVSFALSRYVRGSQPTDSIALALTGASVIDGTGTPPHDDSVVLVRDGRIVDVGPSSRGVIPRDARVIDVTPFNRAAGFQNNSERLMMAAPIR